jgi:chemotaxis protein MotB
MKRRSTNVRKENKERWLLTYSDMITLLMVFFIVLFAMSNVDAKKYQSLAESLNDVFSGQKSVLSNPSQSVVSIMPKLSTEDFSEMEKQLRETIEELGLVSKVKINYESEGIVLSFQDTVLFDLGSANLRPEAENVIDKVTAVLAKSPFKLRVEGNTDDLPINTAQFPSNWDLSVARATSVVRMMIKNPNMDPGRLSIMGYGEYRPVAPNDSPENRQLNRRVDIVILQGASVNPAPPVIQ